MNEFDLDVFVAIAKIRSDGKGPYSEFIFKYINSTNKYENVILNFTNDGILTLLDDEIITNKKRSGEDSLNLTEKTWTGFYMISASVVKELIGTQIMITIMTKI